MSKLMIMFDLENTLIDSCNTILINKVEIIKDLINAFLVSNEPKYEMKNIEFGVFSFAIDLPHEKEKGLKMAFDAIQYKMNSDFCPCWQDLEKLIEIRPGFLQKWEIVNLYGKSGMFDIYTREYPEIDFLLFDDCLDDLEQIVSRINEGKMQTIIKLRV